MGDKRPWQSVTFWGAVLIVVGQVLGSFGVDIGPDQGAISQWLVDVAAAVERIAELVGVAVVLYGRTRARSQLRWPWQR